MPRVASSRLPTPARSWQELSISLGLFERVSCKSTVREQRLSHALRLRRTDSLNSRGAEEHREQDINSKFYGEFVALQNTSELAIFNCCFLFIRYRKYSCSVRNMSIISNVYTKGLTRSAAEKFERHEMLTQKLVLS